MTQNNIVAILKDHPIIPVVTIHSEEEIDPIISKLKEMNIFCIEVTLRTDFAFEALQLIKDRYSDSLSLGVGTVISEDQIDKLVSIGVDFIVSPGLTPTLYNHLLASSIPFIPGVTTPSEIMQAIELGCDKLKFFPANLFGGIKALKTYGNVFPQVKFCPTGGVNESTYEDYLSLENVISVGGSWMIK
ncbi:MAG: bifunctional 4-hydroxy-2-oxoglutarate aldolase/2-dehydro-3-deoxy-phosphogluconate aldolase [Crocinitomicaceae bacterium]|nr:bifunctional 4-hydroxy-2-oxoglutarate aldolase/2-dehydro-3-deoxy-phosphogluconate aldolase [Flavobacteriales bacterium]NQZ34385.1 bifunctional 4-hydroxy-2-oxoglutarate aldolase/2-dehydro-3-deoxy-phosphogluconate aldolase [Crocinitomicaceae bacterium]